MNLEEVMEMAPGLDRTPVGTLVKGIGVMRTTGKFDVKVRNVEGQIVVDFEKWK